ncbi:uncharacterized protein LOC131940196 isoform X2 [Physella acuta]|uniref:uncharacterized protein LOC131940196 isoform X2 n=1 Tax=Physella acuta TaxID=109671 RepID=UPI0027DBB408|nr:uncharacterized protein LOC131940196 isoform X2 [Physella acuta]
MASVCTGHSEHVEQLATMPVPDSSTLPPGHGQLYPAAVTVTSFNHPRGDFWRGNHHQRALVYKEAVRGIDRIPRVVAVPRNTERREGYKSLFQDLTGPQLRTDLKIIFREGTQTIAVNVHREVLESVSELMRHYLLNSVVRNSLYISGNRLYNIRVFEGITEYAYTGDITVNAHIWQILLGSIKFNLPRLTAICEAYLIKSLNLQNVCETYRNASAFIHLPALAMEAKKFITENLFYVSKSSDWLTLKPAEVVNILREDDLVVLNPFSGYPLPSRDRELVILEAIMASFSFNQHHLPSTQYRMLTTVRFVDIGVENASAMIFARFPGFVTHPTVIQVMLEVSRIFAASTDQELQQALDATAPPALWTYRSLAACEVHDVIRVYAPLTERPFIPRNLTGRFRENLEIGGFKFCFRPSGSCFVLGGLGVLYRDQTTKEIKYAEEKGIVDQSGLLNITLDPHEHVTSASIGSSDKIHKLTFGTTLGRTLGPYGCREQGTAVFLSVPRTRSFRLCDLQFDRVLVEGNYCIVNLAFRWISFQ